MTRLAMLDLMAMREKCIAILKDPHTAGVVSEIVTEFLACINDALVPGFMAPPGAPTVVDRARAQNAADLAAKTESAVARAVAAIDRFIAACEAPRPPAPSALYTTGIPVAAMTGETVRDALNSCAVKRMRVGPPPSKPDPAEALWREAMFAGLARGNNGVEASKNATHVVGEWRRMFGACDAGKSVADAWRKRAEALAQVFVRMVDAQSDDWRQAIAPAFDVFAIVNDTQVEWK